MTFASISKNKFSHSVRNALFKVKILYLTTSFVIVLERATNFYKYILFPFVYYKYTDKL